ncbi:MAG: hypothetical protein C0392_12090 [Syntrophus sp. (in: bacteria)]|nr:hypothetical protein [Syntrophus sp. (in: bacteria)]
MNSSYRFELLQPADAEGVALLFTEVYGDAYPIKIVYDPKQLIAALESKDNIPVVARTQSGQIIGYTAFYRSSPNKALYEFGQTLVLPEYRNTPVFGLLARHVVRIAPTLPGLEAAFCENVCNHTDTQRAAVLFKYIEAAIEIDLMPAEAYEKEQSARGRVSAINMFRTFIPKPHTVYVPDRYGDYLRYIYEGFDDRRKLLPSTGELPSGQPTKTTVQIFDFARVARIAVHEAGKDFEESFSREEGVALNRDVLIIQAWLKSSWPWIGEVVHILRNKGYFFGGALPRWFDEDRLLMQKIIGQPNWGGIHLYSSRAKTILEFVKNDWKELQK